MKFFDSTRHTPIAAEVNVLMQSLRLLQRMQITRASVFSDSTIAIKMIRGEIQITSDVYHWILQIKEMRASFESLSFNYVSRQCNRKADYLAKHALSHGSSMLWLENFPQELVSMSNFTHCKCNVSCNCVM